MKKRILFMGAIALSALSFAQTGVGVMTENPQGTFHVDAAGDNAATGTPTAAQQANDFIVTNAGNVGIGTTTPAEKLVVDNGNNKSSVRITSDASTYGEILFSSRYSGYQNSGAAIIADSGSNYAQGIDGGVLRFATSDGFNGGTITTRMTITPVGNVGIGTTTPAVSLHVYGNSSDVFGTLGAGLNATAIIQSSTSATPTRLAVIPNTPGLSSELFFTNYTFGTSTSNSFSDYGSGIRNMSDGADVRNNELYFFTSSYLDKNSTRMFISKFGNVGIGNIAPAYRLDVLGDINASGSVRAAGVALTSDARLKTNIVPMSNGLTTVMRLNPVSYDKKASLASTDYNTHEYGFLAQELQKVLPTLVGEGNDAGHTLSVNYVAIIPVLVKAIQEQQVQIEALKAKK